MQKVIYLSQIREYTNYLDKAVIDYIDEGQVETFESFENFDIIAFDWYDIYDIEAEESQMMVYIDSDDIFVFCEDESSYKKASQIFTAADTNERALYLFFINLLKGDKKYLEYLEDKISDADDAVLTNKNTETAEGIVNFRREILRLKKYYEQLDSIFEELEENDNGLISDNFLKYFVVLGSRTDRLLKSVTNLREFVTQVREAYQAQIDIKQNDLMKVFTVITSIFLPLTLIVGWYGMNFDMPEFSWHFSYPAVICVSALICIVCIIVFKRKKFF